MTHADTFDAFEASAKSAGFTEVLKKDWQSSLALDTHTHPFDVQAQVVAGELWLTAAGKNAAPHGRQRLRIGRQCAS